MRKHALRHPVNAPFRELARPMPRDDSSLTWAHESGLATVMINTGGRIRDRRGIRCLCAGALSITGPDDPRQKYGQPRPLDAAGGGGIMAVGSGPASRPAARKACLPGRSLAGRAAADTVRHEVSKGIQRLPVASAGRRPGRLNPCGS